MWPSMEGILEPTTKFSIPPYFGVSAVATLAANSNAAVDPAKILKVLSFILRSPFGLFFRRLSFFPRF